MKPAGTLYVKLMTLSCSLSSLPDSAKVGISGDFKACSGGRRGTAAVLLSSTNLRQIFVALVPRFRRRRLVDADGVDSDAVVESNLGGEMKLLEASCVRWRPIFVGIGRLRRFFGGRWISDLGEDSDDGDASGETPSSGDSDRLGGDSLCWYCGSRVQNPPFPGSSFDLATLMKHLLSDKLCRIEF